jgi:hypothetical protein
MLGINYEFIGIGICIHHINPHLTADALFVPESRTSPWCQEISGAPGWSLPGKPLLGQVNIRRRWFSV